MVAGQADLRGRLAQTCKANGATAFGVASVDEVDGLKKIMIGSTTNKWSVTVRSIMPEAKSVVMFGLTSTDDADELAIHRGPNAWTYPGYLPLREVEFAVIRVLENEGHSAVGLPELVPHKRVARLAGLGVYGKNSLILSRKHGLWLRFGGVVTDTDLPKDDPLEEDLCGKCDRCVRACPVKAITPYVVDSYKCLVHTMELETTTASFREKFKRYAPQLTPNSYRMCTVCQMVCPYTSAERRRHAIR